MTPEIGERFSYGGGEFVIIDIKDHTDDYPIMSGNGRLLNADKVIIEAERVDRLAAKAARLNDILNALEVDQRADS